MISSIEFLAKGKNSLRRKVAYVPADNICRIFPLKTFLPFIKAIKLIYISLKITLG